MRAAMEMLQKEYANDPAMLKTIEFIEMDLDLIVRASGEAAIAASAGIRVGLRAAAILGKVGWPKGTGKTEHPLWPHARAIWKANKRHPKKKRLSKKVVVLEALERLRKTGWKGNEPSLESLQSHFAEMMK